MPRFILAVILFVLVGVGLIIYKKDAHTPGIVSGVIEGDQIRVGSRVGGRVAEVFAKEGDKVTAGTPLFRIEPFDLEERLSQAMANESAASAELDRLKAGYRPEEIAEAQARYDQLAARVSLLRAGPRPQEIDMAAAGADTAEAKLSLAKIQAERVGALETEKVVSTLEGDVARRDLQVARSEYEARKKQYDMLKEGYRQEESPGATASLAEAAAMLALRKSGFRSEDIRKAEAGLLAAQAERAAAEKAVAELVVRAPAECAVESIDLRPGDLVMPNAPSISLMDLSRLRVRAFIPEH